MPKGKKRTISASQERRTSTQRKKVCKLRWRTQFSHKGPRFPSPYRPIGAQFVYNGIPKKLAPETEEVAVLYARYLSGKRKTKRIEEKLQQNFFNDWRELMTARERSEITDFKLCDFSQLVSKLEEIAEAKKRLPKEEREILKKERQLAADQYKTVRVDSKQELVNNYTVEPPGLYMGRGKDNANIGRVKRRIQPEDIIINTDEKTKVEAPPNHNWKAVIHNRSVMWLASWKDVISGNPKYIQLHSSSSIKNERDSQKFLTARQLKQEIGRVRAQYEKDLKSGDEAISQTATAVYLIDKFALRAGNEKPEGATDTVGCCSLRVEHVSFLNRGKDQKKDLEGIRLNFLGKDSIPYRKDLLVSRAVCDNLKDFVKEKKKNGFLFDMIDTKRVNEYLARLMPDLTAKVFRTFRASQFFHEKLEEYSRFHLRKDKDAAQDVRMKVIVHKKANLAVAQLLNHQTLSKPIGKGTAIKKQEKKLKAAEDKLESLTTRSDKHKQAKVKRDILKEELDLKQQLRNYALGTSKANYIDPTLTVDWCQKYDIPIEKVYSKTQREKFRWALVDL
ncbi:unnamed protein product [Orchesella dallaii]|uniref:DNA topoisomerase 1 n=1 Tax=Orchesella dallaii TaxID=48710 RepID=A0ABP1S6F9_9HEXA